MTKNEHEIVINCPIERAFQFVTDLETWPQWHGGAVEKLTPGPVGVGTVWEATAHGQDRPMVVTVEVTRYELDRRFGITHTSGATQVQQIFDFVPVTGGTRLGMALSLSDLKLAQPAQEQWDNDLTRLKQLLEAQG